MHRVSPRLAGGVFYPLVYLSRFSKCLKKWETTRSILVYYHDCVLLWLGSFKKRTIRSPSYRAYCHDENICHQSQSCLNVPLYPQGRSTTPFQVSIDSSPSNLKIKTRMFKVFFRWCPSLEGLIIMLSCLGGTQGYKALMNSELMHLFIQNIKQIRSHYSRKQF